MFNESVLKSNTGDKQTIARQISYLKVIAILRIQPISLYFDLELHPVSMIKQTPSPNITNEKNTEQNQDRQKNIDGITPHVNNIRTNENTGAMIKYTHSLILVETPSLLNSLIPSNIGCNTPLIETLLGPTRY